MKKLTWRSWRKSTSCLIKILSNFPSFHVTRTNQLVRYFGGFYMPSKQLYYKETSVYQYLKSCYMGMHFWRYFSPLLMLVLTNVDLKYLPV